MARFKLFLRCAKNSHPDILLPNGQVVVVGRGRETKIKDARLSKSQLRLTADYGKKLVLVEAVGANVSAADGKKLGKGDRRFIRPGCTVELLQGRHLHVVEMSRQEGALPGPGAEENCKAPPLGVGSSGKAGSGPGVEKNGEAPPLPKATAGKGPGHWSQGLLASMNDPAMQVFQDHRLVIIKDKYPKARFHFLVLPREKIHDLASLTSDHLPLLEHMHRAGRDLAKEHSSEDFRLGYHAIPSMAQVHMHVISQDFVSPCLKTKRHWNSFNTDYFIPSELVLRSLRETGHVETVSAQEGKELLNTELKCHKCALRPKNMPDLKRHLEAHCQKGK